MFWPSSAVGPWFGGTDCSSEVAVGGGVGGDGGACGQVVLLYPSFLHVEHFFLIPPLLTWVSSFFISDACNLLFFLGRPDSMRFNGGSTSGKGVISRHLGHLHDI